MSETVSPMVEGFSPENMDRIHRGQAALAGGHEARDILAPREFEVLSYNAHGLTHQQMAERMGIVDGTIAQYMATGKERLGVTERIQLVGFFPLGPEHRLVEGKKFADLGEGSRRLEVLEGLSVGLSIEQIATALGITSSTTRAHVREVGEIWEDASGMMLSTGVADAIRARYVQAVEAEPASMEQGLLGDLTLPELRKTEPRILNLIEAQDQS